MRELQICLHSVSSAERLVAVAFVILDTHKNNNDPGLSDVLTG